MSSPVGCCEAVLIAGGQVVLAIKHIIYNLQKFTELVQIAPRCRSLPFTFHGLENEFERYRSAFKAVGGELIAPILVV